MSTRVLVVGARGIPNVEGGAEKNAEELFPRLQAGNYDVTLMGLDKFIVGTSYRGVSLIAAPTWRVLKTDKIAYYLSALTEAIRTRPHIVHLQGLGSAVFLWAYKLMGRKVVVRYGSADYILDKWGFIGKAGFRFAEFQLRFADAVISVAPALSERLAEKGISKNVRMVPNALDDPKYDRVASSEPFVIAVGRVTSQKNFAALCEAFRLLQIDGVATKLVIAGGLDDVEYVSALQANMPDNVDLLGRMSREAIAELLSRAALYVNVSLHEGNSNATLEAISHETPIVISDIAENRNMPVPQVALIDYTTPAAIAAGIRAALANPSAYVVDKANYLTWDDVATRTAAIYEAILAK